MVNEKNKEALTGLLGILTLWSVWVAWLFLGISVLYMGVSLLGNGMSTLSTMPLDQRNDFINFANFATQATYYAAIVMIVAYSLRCFHGTEIGAILTVLGAAFFFGIAYIYPSIEPSDTMAKIVVQKYFVTLHRLGLIALVPGTMFALRDGILTIVMRMSKSQVEIKKGSGEKVLVKRRRKPLVLSHCWDMPNCSDALRRVCPEFQKHKNCWRVKHGCLCDQRMMMRAAGLANMQQGAKPTELGDEGPSKPIAVLTPALKRARCRTCTIYVEHQMQKFKIMTALVVPVTVALLVGFYVPISIFMRFIFVQSEKFLRFLTYDPHAGAQTFQQGLGALVIFAVVWLGILIASLLFKFVEYLTFELKV